MMDVPGRSLIKRQHTLPNGHRVNSHRYGKPMVSLGKESTTGWFFHIFL